MSEMSGVGPPTARAVGFLGDELRRQTELDLASRLELVDPLVLALHSAPSAGPAASEPAAGAEVRFEEAGRKCALVEEPDVLLDRADEVPLGLPAEKWPVDRAPWEHSLEEARSVSGVR